MRCIKILRQFLISLIILVLLSIINKNYIIELYNKRCVPYNAHVERNGTNYVVYWYTLAKCETYLRYKKEASQDYKVKYPDSHFLLKYKAYIPASDVLPNFMVIVSNGQTYKISF